MKLLQGLMIIWVGLLLDLATMAKGYSDEAYARKRVRVAERDREMSAEGRDIGELPPIENEKRREKARHDLEYHLRTYHPETFKLPFSDDHRRMIRRAEESTIDGGLFAFAAPRGTGKTSICEGTIEWSILHAWRQFPVLIGADEQAALDMLASLKIELETNELLLADFPEICYPIQCLEGIAHRCRGQTYRGQRTFIGWQKKTLILPTIEGSAASGTIVKVAGITGRIRGMKHKTPSGDTRRPDQVVIDDAQTDESARSPSQCAKIESILAGAILGLAGPSKKIAGLFPCTIIARNDAAARILNRDLHPEWHGETSKMLYSMPSNTALWDEYTEIYKRAQFEGVPTTKATAFYKKHRKKMDAGAKVGWENRYNSDEISALQHAMNLKIRDEQAFWAEYQNEPRDAFESEIELLTVDQIAEKVSGYKEGVVPQWAQHITAFVDVGAKLLWYAVCAFGDDFTGQVLEYGACPDQALPYYTSSSVRRTLATLAPKAGIEGQIYKGLDSLCGRLAAKIWKRDDGAEMTLNLGMIDSGWGISTDVVFEYVRQSGLANIWRPSKGVGITASDRPMDEWPRKPGDRVGLNWRQPALTGKRRVRYVLFDANWWKTFLFQRFGQQHGDHGSLALYKGTPKHHRMIAEHLTAEYPVRTEGRGRTVYVWKEKPGRLDNHLGDCLVGCCVAESMLGGTLPEHQTASAKPSPTKPSKRKRVSYL